MTNKQMDEKIRQAFESITPNVLGAIVSRCTKRAGNVKFMKSRRSTGWTARFITVAAASILILVLTTGLIDRLPPLFPTGPLFTGTDPTGTNPTQPDALTWVDWGMNATWVTKNGTAQGQYPMQIKGLIQNKEEIRLKLEIYTPDSLGYQFTAPDGGYSPNQYAGLVEHPGDYYDSSRTYSIKANKFVETHWAISTTKEYFIAYWPEKPDLFLVGASDPSVSAAEVMAYFDKFVEKFRPVEPEPTDPEPTDPQPTDPDEPISLDWSMKALWVMANGDRRSSHSMTVKGTIVNHTNTTYLDLKIDVGQNFPYQFILPEPDGYAAGTRLVQAEGDYNTAGYVQDVATKETVWSAWAVSSEKEYFIFVLPDHPDKFLVGATDPNVTAKQILDYFDLFVDHYLPDPVDPPEPDILDWFPKDIDTNAVTRAVFQDLLSRDSWHAQALYAAFDDPRDIYLHNFFYGVKFQDEAPITQEERDTIVAMSGREDCSWMDGARFPVEKMNKTLQEVFGISLDDMHDGTLWAMHYLESTDSYYYFNSGSKHVGDICVIGTKALDNGNMEVYYTRGYGLDPAEHGQRGVVTVKPVGDSYHILSNYYSEDGTWPDEETPKPVDPWLMIPDQFPDDLITDEANLAVYQYLFDSNDWYRHALCLGYDDPRKMSLHRFFYDSSIVWEHGITDEERTALVEQTGIEAFYGYEFYRLSAEKMDAVLKEIYGISLDEVHEGYFYSLYYLESTDSYYYFANGTAPVPKVYVLGIRILENGDRQVYYSHHGYTPVSSIEYGYMTIRSTETGYQVVSNHDIAIWPIPGQEPEIPEGAPVDLNTDPDVVLKYQRLFYDDRWYPQALFMEFDDPRNIRLKDFLFDSCKPWPFKHFTDDAERKELFDQLGLEDLRYDWTGIEASTVEEILQTVFGLSLDDFTDEAKEGYYYLESTDSYYYGGEWTNSVVNVTVVGVRELNNGNVEVYYTTSGSGLFKGVVTLKPVGDSYIVIANAKLEK